MLFISNQTTAKTRRETRNGQEYLVVPVVAVKPGILNDELITLEEIAHGFEAWNGRPVVVDHPEIDGEQVSANTPEMLDKYQIGWLFNTALVDDKLVPEMWLDLSRVPLVDGGAQAVQRFEHGEMTEVSTAYLRDLDATPGTLDGEDYVGIARNINPDHLAILLDDTGACSIADGCGAPRVNAAEPGGPILCVCPACGYETEKERAVPCRSLVCPECGAELIAGGDMELNEADKVQSPTIEVQEQVHNDSWLVRAVKLIANTLKVNLEVTGMNKEELVKHLMESELGFNEEELTGMAQSALEKLAAMLQANQEPDEEVEPEPDEEEVETLAANEDEETPCQDEQIKSLVADVAVLKAAMQANADSERAPLVEAIVANCSMTAEQLVGLDLPALVALRASTVPADYSTQGGGELRTARQQVEAYQMPDIFVQEVQ